MESAVSNFLDICPPFEIVDVCVMYLLFACIHCEQWANGVWCAHYLQKWRRVGLDADGKENEVEEVAQNGSHGSGVMARREESDDDWKVEGKVESEDGKWREIELPVRILDAKSADKIEITLNKQHDASRALHYCQVIPNGTKKLR